jgi:antitoxin (DNA-binding transcriptional repressor) of toxin-antitoxin stability system
MKLGLLGCSPLQCMKEVSAMATVTIEEAQANLAALIHRLGPGEELLITENDRPVAKLVVTAPPEPPKKLRQFGTLRGTVLSMEHFDDPLDDFAEYM